MRRLYTNLRSAAVLLGGLTTALSASAQLAPGNVVVLQAGDGSTTLAASGTAVFLKAFTRNTANQINPVNTITVPTTGAMRFVIAGNASTEGSLSLSADSTKLVFAGYDTSLNNTVNLNTTTAANVRRVVDTVGGSGVPGRADTSATAFSATNFRGAVKGLGEDYWGVGGNSGVLYLGNTAAPTSLGTTATNLRLIQTLNGNLYYAAAGTVYKITGMPTAGPATSATLFTVPSGSIYGFAINAAETIAYIADDRGPASGGGIQKWVNNGGAWAVADTLFVGSGARGLAVDWSGTQPVLFTTTTAATANSLVQVVDSNYAAGYLNTYVTLATAPANTVFRGLAFSPKAQTLCTAPTLTTTVTAAGCTSGGSITLTATGGSPVNSYAWTGPGGFTATSQNISNLNPGSYSVTATTIGGCTATAMATVVRTGGITATATAAGPAAFCQGGSVVLNANTGTGYTYQWINGAAIIPGATGASYTATAGGSYRVRVASGACFDTSVALPVTVQPRPTASITAASDTAFCAGDSVTLNSNSGTGYTYRWFNGASVLAGATSGAYVAHVSGAYRVVVTNSNGCADTSRAVLVTAKPLPMPVVVYSGGQLSVQNASMYTNFRWYLNGGATPIATSASLTPSTNGSYMLRADSNGCTGVSNTVAVSDLSVLASAQNTFAVYPNPAKDAFEILPAGAYNVRITDLQGRTVLQAENTSRVAIASLANGVYLLHIRTKNGAEATPVRLLKQ